MFAAALIVFRETLEAALFIGIVAAATRGLSGRSRWLAGGVLAGACGALALAAAAERIGSWAGGVGQDLVNVGILFFALAMLAWHCIWISPHGHEMAKNAKRLGSSIRDGGRAPWALTAAVALAVLREGAETVLFVAGLGAGAAGGTSGLLLGAGTGLVSGALVGVLIYLGLSFVSPRRLFALTNVLILLLAAAIASQLARALSQAGLVEFGGLQLWDSSSFLASDSPLGALLHALVGYDDRPSALQLAFYLGTLLVIAVATRHVQRRIPAAPRNRAVHASATG